MEEQLKCKNCNEPMEPYWKLCPECHQSVAPLKKCWCGQELKETWKKCPVCGKEQRSGHEKALDEAIADFSKVLKVEPRNPKLEDDSGSIFRRRKKSAI